VKFTSIEKNESEYQHAAMRLLLLIFCSARVSLVPSLHTHELFDRTATCAYAGPADMSLMTL